MTNPTSNFGWQMPTPTDLVTDLPADFEVFGQAVDTDFADLLGGTTGQILSKASATDLDFTWITNDVGDITAVTAGTGISGGGTSGAVTVTNSMATAIDAKGDLIAGTAADTFDRLAIGTNTSILMADSTATTGIKWDDGTYLTWTPASYQNFTLGNGTVSGRYRQIGKTVFYNLSIVFGTTTSITGSLGIQLPVGVTANTANNGANIGIANLTDTGVNGYFGYVYQSATNLIQVLTSNVSATYPTNANVNTTTPFTWGSTDTLFISGTYDRP